MAKRVEAIEGSDGMLHLAVLEGGTCKRLLSEWGVFFGEAALAGALKTDLMCAAEDRWFWSALGDNHSQYVELLLAGGTQIIAILEATDSVLRYVDRDRMGGAGRHWLGEGEDVVPSGTVMAVTWVAPADRKEG